MLALLALAAARLLRLREASLERLHVDEVHVAAHFLLGILGDDVIADQVSGDQARLGSRRCERLAALSDGLRRGSRSRAEVFQEECVAAGRLQRAGPGRERHGLLVHAVDRVVQLQAAQAEVVGRLEPHGDLLDAGCAPVAARLEDLDLGLLVRHGGDEVVLGQADPLSPVHGCHVVGGVLPHYDLRAVVPQRDFLVANHKQAVRKVLVRGEDDPDLGASHRHDVAAWILHAGLEAAPCRVLELQPDVLHRGHGDDVNLELATAQPSRLDVVAQRLSDHGEREPVARALQLRSHRGALPVHAALELRIQLDQRRLEAERHRGHFQPAPLADRGVPGLDLQLVERILVREEPPGPKPGRAVAPIAGTGGTEPVQGQHCEQARRGEQADQGPAHHRVQGHHRRCLRRLAG